MLGVIVNTVAVIFGSLLGLLLKKGFPEKITGPIMTGIGLCVVYIGIDGMLCGSNALVAIASMVVGAVIGTLLDIDGKFNRLGGRLETRFDKSGESGNFAKAFVNSTLLFCVGAMTIVGSINAGLKGDNTILFTKSLLDMISSVLIASSLGIGVLFSAVAVFVYQGLIVVLAGVLEPVLTETAINEMSCVGYILIVALGLNMLNITKIKVADYIPAIIVAPLFAWLFSYIM